MSSLSAQYTKKHNIKDGAPNWGYGIMHLMGFSPEQLAKKIPSSVDKTSQYRRQKQTTLTRPTEGALGGRTVLGS